MTVRTTRNDTLTKICGKTLPSKFDTVGLCRKLAVTICHGTDKSEKN